MKKSLIVGIAVGALALFGIAWAAAPVMAAQALIRAAKAQVQARVLRLKGGRLTAAGADL